MFQKENDLLTNICTVTARIQIFLEKTQSWENRIFCSFDHNQSKHTIYLLNIIPPLTCLITQLFARRLATEREQTCKPPAGEVYAEARKDCPDAECLYLGQIFFPKAVRGHVVWINKTGRKFCKLWGRLTQGKANSSGISLFTPSPASLGSLRSFHSAEAKMALLLSLLCC